MLLQTALPVVKTTAITTVIVTKTPTATATTISKTLVLLQIIPVTTTVLKTTAQALAPETPEAPQAPTADVKTTADAPPAAEPFSATPAAIPIHAAVKAEAVLLFSSLS